MNGEWWSALPPLPLPHEMQQWDRQAVELGILPEILMENAAAAAFRQLNALCPRLAEKQVCCSWAAATMAAMPPALPVICLMPEPARMFSIPGRWSITGTKRHIIFGRPGHVASPSFRWPR